ncbi:hypothetical protein HHL21_17815 [Massilia sp. RP-1-19]|uniref:Uncharacterized protein n=1 Tax=Massilia polaris TaxID=2728846 RepID=A0A848HT46_9BURK|nr:hypothetical protein [Massilia polaris]NML62901.1 hypothetical protein [Massilia polaris]
MQPPLRGATTGFARVIKHIGLEFIMRTSFAIALAAAASFVTFSQAAAQDAQAAPQSSTAVQISGVSPAPYRMDREEAEEVKGIYQLSNGKYMRVATRGNRLVAEIDGERRSNLVPVGHKVFVAPVTDTVVAFDEPADGRMNDVVLRPRRQAGYAFAD